MKKSTSVILVNCLSFLQAEYSVETVGIDDRIGGHQGQQHCCP